MSKIRVVSTKILSDIQKQKLIQANFEVTEANFIKIENLPFSFPSTKNLEKTDNLIFTSQNAVRSVLQNGKWERLKSKNVFCVGLKTKALLAEAGFHVVVYTDYASDLAEIIRLHHNSKNYIFFSGNLRQETLPLVLKKAAIKFTEIQTYETTLTPHTINSKNDAILFFSPSGVESYLKKNKIEDENCFCIGETTAKALNEITKNIVVADQPTIEIMIENIITQYK